MGNKKLKTMLHSPLQFDILNIESEKKKSHCTGRAPGRALCVLGEEAPAGRSDAGTVAVAMGKRVTSVTKKAKEKARTKNQRAAKAGTTTTTTTTTTTQSTTTAPAVDLAEVRKNISNIVGSNAAAMATAVMEAGKAGQLAPVKYLFEVSGLYPASEGSASGMDQEVLARTLMRGLNLPETPMECEDGEETGSGNQAAAPKQAGDAGRAKPAGSADSGTRFDGKHSDGEDEPTAERAGTMP
jgi:hypothetical protein